MTVVFPHQLVLKFWSCCLCLLLPIIGYSQKPQELLENAIGYYKSDQLDSARHFYQLAYQTTDADIQLQAVEGLVKVAILKAELGRADSLLQIGDDLIENKTVGPAAICEFETARGEYYRSNSQFEKALAQHRAVIQKSADLEGGEVIHAYALYYTGLTFERLGTYDSSLIYVNRAYQIFREQLDTTSLEFSGIYNGLGVCHYRANRLEEAKFFYLKSKAIAEEKLGPVSSDLAMCLNNLSSIFRAEENYQQAIQYSEQALKISRALKDEASISSAYYALGVYHYFMGDYGRTKDYMEACIAIRERLYDANHYSLIGPYEVLGIAEEESGNYQQTLYCLRKVRRKIKANYGPGSLVEGFNYENTAICFKTVNQLDSALHYIQLASQIIPVLAPENDYSVGVHYFNYGNILYLQGKLEKAEQMVEKSMAIYQAVGLDHTTEYAQNLTLQGLIAAEQANWTKADQLFQMALEIVRLPSGALEGEGYQMRPNTLSVLHEYLQYLITKYQADVAPGVLKQFEKFSAIYLDLSDDFRKQFHDPYTKSVLIKDNATVYKRIIGFYQQLYRKTGHEKYLKAVYQFSENGRTCLLRDLQDDKIKSYAGIPDSVVQKELALKNELTRLNQQLLENPASDTVKRALFASKEAFNAHLDQTLKAYPKYYDLKFNSKIPDLAAVQAQLDQRALIEYLEDDTAYYALVIQLDAAELLHLGNRQKINETVADWKRALVSQEKKQLDQTGRILYQKLWQPLAEKLSGERVIIIPSGTLFYLNFETLPTGNASAPFLIYDYNISYALSINVLLSKVPQSSKKGLLAVVPGFEDDIKLAYRNQRDTIEPIDDNFLHTIRQPWSLKLANSLKQKFDNQAYIGLQATESNLKKNIHKGRILYFGTHAIANASDPLRSKLVLAKEAGAQEEDGYLHAYELYGLPLEAELAVLNACESGLGELQEGEGMISLAYSIHYAGCPSTVMSLWKVDEKVSTQITEKFLDYLADGYTKSGALRQAKLDYLGSANAVLQHPFFWGGMVLMGQDGVVSFQRRWPKRLWFAGLGFLLLVVGIWAARRVR
mgnify:CR=1 FL=1